MHDTGDYLPRDHAVEDVGHALGGRGDRGAGAAAERGDGLVEGGPRVVALGGVDGSSRRVVVMAAIKAGKELAVASKEILVMAGEIVMNEARKHGARVALPIVSDAGRFIAALLEKLKARSSAGAYRDWIAQCRNRSTAGRF